jgi:predicted outer membrane protein
MSSIRTMAAIALLLLTLAVPAAAQTPDPQPTAPPAVTRPMDAADLRRHIYVMEGALAKAVEFGARRLNREIRSAMPEVMALSGEPQARGVYLEGYGIYFDVSVPVLNQVMMWSLRTMMGPDAGVITALNQLKSYVQTEKNPTTRASLEGMIERLELQFGPINSAGDQPFPANVRQSAGTVGAAMVSPDAPRPAQTDRTTEQGFDRKYFQDPNAINRIYTESVQNALVDTIIDYAIPTSIKPDEFLTVAARDNMQRDTLAPPDPYEEVVTILLRIRGSDLAAYRAGQIDAAEVRRRIQVREQ